MISRATGRGQTAVLLQRFGQIQTQFVPSVDVQFQNQDDVFGISNGQRFLERLLIVAKRTKNTLGKGEEEEKRHLRVDFRCFVEEGRRKESLMRRR